MLAEGELAPDFSLDTDGGGSVCLSDLRGKNVVVYFYPKDSTPGCTKEAIAFTELKEQFSAANTEIIGVSKDSVKRHDNFKEKYDLQVTLASDEEGKMVESYGVWVLKKNYGREYMGIERATFLIDTKGVIQKIWRKVKVKEHAEAVLAAAQAL